MRAGLVEGFAVHYIATLVGGELIKKKGADKVVIGIAGMAVLLVGDACLRVFDAGLVFTAIGGFFELHIVGNGVGAAV